MCVLHVSLFDLASVKFEPAHYLTIEIRVKSMEDNGRDEEGKDLSFFFFSALYHTLAHGWCLIMSVEEEI